MTKTTQGSIITTTNGFNIYKSGRFFCAVEWTKGNASHVDAVRFLARKYFGNGALRRTSSTELPSNQLSHWGFTREACPVGEVSVTVNHYQIIG